VYEAIGGAVSAFSNAAMSGQVSIEAEAAADALTKIGKVKSELIALNQSAAGGATEVEMGANPVGVAMSKKSMGRFDGDDSFIAAVGLLLEQTEKAEIALRQCIDNYVDTDLGHAAKFQRGTHA
jgi:hypothetical protein